MRTSRAALLAACVAGAASAQTAVDFDPPADPGEPALVLRTWPAELGPAVRREIRVFADGRCERDRATFQPGPGGTVRRVHTERFRVGAAEARALVAQALDAGAADLDARAVQRSLRAARAAADDGVHHHVLDEDVVEVELHAARVRAPGRAERRDVRHVVRWVGLRADLREHPGDARVQRMGALRDALESVANAAAPTAAGGAP
ncbi:MAG: hypothetical protein R3E88_03215 [Myxococcota bacterium]